jgi:hypothetical protein
VSSHGREEVTEVAGGTDMIKPFVVMKRGLQEGAIVINLRPKSNRALYCFLSSFLLLSRQLD